MSTTKKVKNVFTITEQKNGKPKWNQVGVAFENKDKSLNILLHSLPITGKLQVRDIETQQS